MRLSGERADFEVFLTLLCSTSGIWCRKYAIKAEERRLSACGTTSTLRSFLPSLRIVEKVAGSPRNLHLHLAIDRVYNERRKMLEVMTSADSHETKIDERKDCS